MITKEPLGVLSKTMLDIKLLKTESIQGVTLHTRLPAGKLCFMAEGSCLLTDSWSGNANY